MVLNNDQDYSYPDGHVPDEAWWQAVLGDEDKFDAGPELSPETSHTTHAAAGHNNWEYLDTLYRNDEVIQLLVTGFNRGGLLVEGNDIHGFVPFSHLIDVPALMNEEGRKAYFRNYIGRQISLKIIELVPEDERIVLSERAAQAGQGRRKAIFENIQAGDIVWGTVTNVTGFGAFVDLGGVEGLIHVSELSWGRVEHPGDIVCIGQRIEAQVLNIEKENSHVALSAKRLESNPWEKIHEIYTLGEIVTAKITSVTNYGAFARLKEGVEGLIHISSIPIPAGTNLEEYLVKKQCVQVRILHIDSEKKRIGLALV
jgi:small subunit ribosomal protein S1